MTIEEALRVACQALTDASLDAAAKEAEAQRHGFDLDAADYRAEGRRCRLAEVRLWALRKALQSNPTEA